MTKKGQSRNWARPLKPLCNASGTREEVEILRSSYWYDELSNRMGWKTPYALERIIEPEAFGKCGLNYYHRNKWRHYESGKHSPQRTLREKTDKIVEGSADAFDHVLWEALKTEYPLGDRTNSLLRTLGPEVLNVVFAPSISGASRSYRRKPVDGHMLRKLEDRAGMDALASLTLLLREAHENGQRTLAFKIGLPLLWVLLIFCTTCSATRISYRLFDLYLHKIFPLATTGNRAYCLERYPLSRATSLLTSCVLAAEDRGAIGLSWEDTVSYMMQIIRGRFGLDLRIALVPEIEISKGVKAA